MFGNIVVIPRNWLLLFQKSQTRSRKEGLLESWTFVALLEIQTSNIIVLDRSLKKAVDHVNSTRETCPFNSISEKAGLTLNLCDHNNSVVA